MEVAPGKKKKKNCTVIFIIDNFNDITSMACDERKHVFVACAQALWLLNFFFMLNFAF